VLKDLEKIEIVKRYLNGEKVSIIAIDYKVTVQAIYVG
jgi:hypothetical protein